MALINKNIYINEDIGKDKSTVDDSKLSPYRTLFYTHIQHPPSSDQQYLIQKSLKGLVSGNNNPNI